MEFDKKKDNTDRHKVIQELAPYMSLGMQMAITLLLGVFVGYKLDEYFNTQPIFLASLSFVFAALSLVNFIREVINKSSKEKKQ